MEMLQGLLLWMLLSMGRARASREPLRPLCRPINATLAAEKEACPVCITVNTTICAGSSSSKDLPPSPPSPSRLLEPAGTPILPQ
uniref:Glycoprotein hormone subunit beta domain-containing protein n=1 Tax=Colobus angolensis palliatus TaxID=336983 RepID=A0A2K5IQK3_COLAP